MSRFQQKSPRHLLYKSKIKNKYTLRNTSTSIPTVGWKITKKQLHIIDDTSIPGRSPHCGFNHRLLFICEITVPDVHDCVSYIITRMESPTLCHKKYHLQLDVLSVKKLWLFLISFTEEHCVHLESLFSKHTKYLLKIYHQIIQSRRFKKASITLKRVLKNVTEWYWPTFLFDQI